MTNAPAIFLVASPLLGPYSWTPLAEALRHRGWEVAISSDVRDELQPQWRQALRGAEMAAERIPTSRSVILVAHSGAGPLLPAIGEGLPQHTSGYVFIDAGLPTEGGASRLEEIESVNKEFAEELRTTLENGGRYPTWRDEDLGELVPDPASRRALLAELRPRGLDFWTEALPSTTGWPDAPCAYLLFSPPYRPAADRARRVGWPTRLMEAGHFHQVVDPPAVADALMDMLREMGLSVPESDLSLRS